ncbi:MAG: uncharacterized protein A8A55_2292, partial [Amphiamblys sp. WSBS2006]
AKTAQYEDAIRTASGIKEQSEYRPTLSAVYLQRQLDGNTAPVGTEKNETSVEGLYNTAVLLANSGRHDDATATIRKVKENAFIQEAVLGYVSHRQSNLEEALAHYRTCIDVYAKERDSPGVYSAVSQNMKAILHKGKTVAGEKSPEIESVSSLRFHLHQSRHNRRACKELLEKYKKKNKLNEETAKTYQAVCFAKENTKNLSPEESKAEVLGKKQFSSRTVFDVCRKEVLSGASPLPFLERCLSACAEKDAESLEEIKEMFTKKDCVFIPRQAAEEKEKALREGLDMLSRC